MSAAYTNAEREAHVRQLERIVRDIKERIAIGETFITKNPNISRAAASVAKNRKLNIDIPELLARAYNDLAHVEQLLQKMIPSKGGKRNRTRNHKRKCTRRR